MNQRVVWVRKQRSHVNECRRNIDECEHRPILGKNYHVGPDRLESNESHYNNVRMTQTEVGGRSTICVG